ncbi:MAG: DNA primase [Rhodothermales bacterium]|nr:DNA primase [Rhodothermales bacterium]
MRIPEEKVDEIRTAIGIVDVVGDYVSLKRRGSNYTGLCPFHQEKTPSFNVNPEIGIFKCFGCGAGGNSFQFLMRVENLTFPEAVRLLADKAGIPLPEDDTPAESNENESIYNALRFAARFFYRQLTREREGEAGLAYLLGRGFTKETIKAFGLGYAPDAWDALLTAATEASIESEILEKAGLIIPRRDKGGYYDRYRGRVIFPILSHIGKVLGFGGRILAPAEDQPKYINSPETSVYHKSQVLYGLSQAKDEIRQRGEVILVEGYTDVITLHQAGVRHVVSSSGTALTSEQVKLISRYAKRVLVLYDADSAGANAAVRGLDIVLEQGLAVYSLALPAGEDPDSFVREKGGEALIAYLDRNRQDFVTFKYAQARATGQLATPEGQAAAMRSILETISRLPDPLLRETYLRRASDVLQVPDIELREVMGTLGKKTRPTAPASTAEPRRRDEERGVDAPAPAAYVQPLPQEKMLLRLMLEHGNPMVEYILGHMSMDEFSEGVMRETVERVLAMYHAGGVDRLRFIETETNPYIVALATEVLVQEHAPSIHWERKQNIPIPRFNEAPYETAGDSMKLLKLRRVKEAIDRKKDAIFRAQKRGEDLRPLQEQMSALRELQKAIQRKAFLE